MYPYWTRHSTFAEGAHREKGVNPVSGFLAEMGKACYNPASRH
jgi:hypothetical protein